MPTTPPVDVTAKYLTTTISTPARSNLATVVQLGNRLVVAINILFAPGHVALTGVALQYNGVQMLPYNQAGAFIYGDSERLDFELGIYGPGKWTVNTHNGDSVAHVHQLTWTLRELATGPLGPDLGPLPVVVA